MSRKLKQFCFNIKFVPCRTDAPRYLIYSKGRQIDDMLDLGGFDLSNHTSFYIGCSFSFEQALKDAGISLRYMREGNNTAMFDTNIECYNAGGKFPGVKMVVSMRGVAKDKLQQAVTISSSFPLSHGCPINIGDPTRLGITDITTPTYGDHTEVNENEEIPVFWGCGITSKHAVEALSKSQSIDRTYLLLSLLPPPPLSLSTPYCPP